MSKRQMSFKNINLPLLLKMLMNVFFSDYVIAKFFQPIEVAYVPVYYGTPNIDDFASEHSYINVQDFKSSKE